MRKGLSYLAYGVAAGVVLVGASHDALRAAGSSTSDKLALFAEVFNKVRDNYAEKPDDEKMVKSAIDGMLASLDPHSNYFDPKALQDFQSSMKGEEFGGLGLEVMMENGLVKVVSPIDDTPAARAGLMSGDLVTRIDDTAVKGLSLKEAVDKMRGKAKHPGQADRRARIEPGREGVHDRPRDHPCSVGALASGERRHRLYPHHAVQPGGVRRGAQGLRSFPRRTRPGEFEGLRPRSAQQSRGPAQPGGRDHQRLRRYRRHRFDPRPKFRPGAALLRPPRRQSLAGQAGGGAHQWRLGFGLGDRLRRLAGSQARDADRHAHVSARGPFRPSCRSAKMAHSSSPPPATTRLPAARSRPRASIRTSGCSKTFPTT